MYKIRYNLQNGIYKNHWQVKYKNKIINYYDPKDNIIKIYDCFLFNNIKIANKIFSGSSKTVCAYIKFSRMELLINSKNILNSQKINYNPKVLPYWHFSFSNESLDSVEFKELYLTDKGVFYDYKI